MEVPVKVIPGFATQQRQSPRRRDSYPVPAGNVDSVRQPVDSDGRGLQQAWEEVSYSVVPRDGDGDHLPFARAQHDQLPPDVDTHPYGSREDSVILLGGLSVDRSTRLTLQAGEVTTQGTEPTKSSLSLVENSS